MSNSLDPDQSRCFVRPDLGPNFLQMLSADDRRLLAGKELSKVGSRTAGDHNAMVQLGLRTQLNMQLRAAKPYKE